MHGQQNIKTSRIYLQDQLKTSGKL